MWRPINGTVEDYTLAFCDPFSVDAAADLIAGDRITSQHVGEVYYIAHNARQRWFWLSDQTTDEVILFNSYDSARGIGPACECTSYPPTGIHQTRQQSGPCPRTTRIYMRVGRLKDCCLLILDLLPFPVTPMARSNSGTHPKRPAREKAWRPDSLLLAESFIILAT